MWLPSPSLWPLCLDLRIADTCKKFILGHFPGNCTRIALSAWRNSPPFHILSIFCSPTGKTTYDNWGRRLTFSNIGLLGAFAFCSKRKRMSWETVKDLSNKLQNMEYCVKSIMEFNSYWCYISCYELFHCEITSIIFNVTHWQTTFKILIWHQEPCMTYLKKSSVQMNMTIVKNDIVEDRRLST